MWNSNHLKLYTCIFALDSNVLYVIILCMLACIDTSMPLSLFVAWVISSTLLSLCSRSCLCPAGSVDSEQFCSGLPVSCYYSNHADWYRGAKVLHWTYRQGETGLIARWIWQLYWDWLPLQVSNVWKKHPASPVPSTCHCREEHQFVSLGESQQLQFLAVPRRVVLRAMVDQWQW